MITRLTPAQEAYNRLSEKAIIDCEEMPLSFKLWVRHYGLYCSGKEIGMSTTLLGQALYKAELGKMTKSEKAIIEKTREALGAELIFDNSSLKLTQR